MNRTWGVPPHQENPQVTYISPEIICSPQIPMESPWKILSFWDKACSGKELTEGGDEQIYDKQKAGSTYSRPAGYK